MHSPQLQGFTRTLASNGSTRCTPSLAARRVLGKHPVVFPKIFQVYQSPGCGKFLSPVCVSYFPTRYNRTSGARETTAHRSQVLLESCQAFSSLQKAAGSSCESLLSQSKEKTSLKSEASERKKYKSSKREKDLFYGVPAARKN